MRKDPEARRKYFQEYRERKREEIQEQQRRWYEANREHANERDRRNYQQRRRLSRDQDVLSGISRVSK